MFKRITAIAITLCLLPLGCMLEETTHVLFIEKDGAVTWRVFQDLLRSDRDRPGARLDEEASFLDEVDAGEDHWSQTFEQYGAEEVDAWTTRDRRPYSMIVQARFEDLEQLTVALVEDAELEADVRLEQDGDRVRYELTVWPPEEEASDENEDEAWAWARSHFRIALAEGRFVEARGFEISDDGAIAVPRALTEEELAASDGGFTYSLTWDLGR